MNIQLMTSVWGDQHVDLFSKTCLRSLAQRQNRAALYENKAEWNIFTEDKYFLQIERIVDAHLPELKLNLRSTKELRQYIDPVQAATIWQMERCIETKSRLLIAPPDTIFGESSVANLIKTGYAPESVVVVPHVRVHPTILNEDLFPFVTNQELVSKAWKHLHKSWSEAEVGHAKQNSFCGGVSWQMVQPGIYSVKHYLPTPYLIDFLEDDLLYFKRANSFGHFDHVWCGDLVVPRGRQRYIASSDLSFMVEITDQFKNVPQIWNGPVDGFWRQAEHNKMNAQVVATFRGQI